MDSVKAPCKLPSCPGGRSRPLSTLRWAAGKHHISSNAVRGHCMSPEKEAEQIHPPAEDPPVPFPDVNGFLKRHRTKCDGTEHRKLPACRDNTPGAPPALHVPECIAAGEKQSPNGTSEKAGVYRPVTQVPLKLQIKVSGQRGSLGISIAGGKGSIPYREHDEGIFISHLSRGGPAEKAGIHVGDRVLEVNGFGMQDVTHHEAVSALRNAGSCIRMKVLRERSMPSEMSVREDPAASRTDIFVNRPHAELNERSRGSNQHSTEPALKARLAEDIQAVVTCNGNAASQMEKDLTDASFKNNALQVMKTSMSIPRIILTHPSTSDEDIEPLAQDSEGNPDEFADEDGDGCGECTSSAFYPP